MLFTVALIFTVSSSFTKNEEVLTWHTNIEIAKQKAKSENRKIFMNFSGSDWCANCMRLEKTLFESKEFYAYAKANLILLKVDFPAKKKNALTEEQQNHNDKLADKYNKLGVFPSVFILDYNTTVLGQMKHPQKSNADYLNNINTIVRSK